MKIALIGPGLMQIPPVGWGAVEMLIWKYHNLLIENGHEVTIFNSRNLKQVANEINNSNFDFIHVHYDEFAGFFAKHLNKPFCTTSHYGLILQQQLWSKGYYSVFINTLKSPGIITLSKEIEELYKEYNYAGEIYTLANGINVEEFRFDEQGNHRALYLGKIEPRKRQVLVTTKINNSVTLDFVGPLADKNFKETENCNYLGSWTTEEVRQKLTNYSTLVLLSEGEAAPLVVIEALAAGVSVVISKAAAANLDTTLPFITVLSEEELENNDISKIILDSVEGNNNYREQIRNYALKNFDNKVIIKQYLDIIYAFNSQDIKSLPIPDHSKIVLLKYLFSSFWYECSQIQIFRAIKDFIYTIILLWKTRK